MKQLENWPINDQLYSPKRRVDNKASATSPHIMGGFYSRINNQSVAFQSLNEAIFYYLLELAGGICRYYPQSVEVMRVGYDKNGHLKQWYHIPDVLVFGETPPPILYQIKEVGFTETENYLANNEACIRLCKKNGWGYRLALPKLLPHVVRLNINFLIPHLRSRAFFKNMIPPLKEKLIYLKKTTIWELAQSCSYNTHPLLVLPAVWHLLATGVFQANFHEPFSQHSEIWVREKEDQTISRFLELITKEVQSNETQEFLLTREN